jgi:hypothetical protein
VGHQEEQIQKANPTLEDEAFSSAATKQEEPCSYQRRVTNKARDRQESLSLSCISDREVRR